MEVSEMSILIKLFLMAYLLVIVLMSVLSVIWVMSLIFTPEWLKRKLPIKH
jgi:hypothetical protein